MSKSLDVTQAAEQLLLRRKARQDLNAWARVNGFEPAAHHKVINRALQLAVEGQKLRLAGKPALDFEPWRRIILLCPPGSAKSTYTSVLFPPFYLGQITTACILSCSYGKDLAARFGKRCRNIIQNKAPILGYDLSKHTQAADDWETSLGGIYFAAGVGGGIAGHRADLGLIDDYIGSQEDADSQIIRDKQWDWYLGDFAPRLKPGAVRIIICNRRHEDDLVGRILDPKNGEAGLWTVIRFPMIAEDDNDVLGRKAGERLWPEWYTEDMVREARRVPRIWAGLYQQRPSPEEGDYFQKAWLKGYEPQDLPKNLRIYGAGDFAVSEEVTGNKSCYVSGGVDENGVLWILPDIYWEKADAAKSVDALLNLCRKYKYFTFWAEKGHISKSVGPFLRKRMLESRVYVNIEEVTPSKAKDVRARPLQGRMSMGMVRFPKFAPWWPEAEHEMLMAFNGKNDDFVDALAHLAAGIDQWVAPQPKQFEPSVDQVLKDLANYRLTFNDIKRSHKAWERKQLAAMEN